MFSILFLDEISFPSTGYLKTDLRTLNYTVVGAEPFLTNIIGVWVDVNMQIPQDIKNL